MFHTHVASVCSKYLICFRRMLHTSVSRCKCFVFQRYVQRVMGARPERQGKGCGEPGAGRWGVWRAWGPTDGGVLILILALGSRLCEERGGGVAGKVPQAQRQGAGVCVQELQGEWG